MSEEGSNVAKSLRLIVQNLDKFRETVKNRFLVVNERLDGYEKEITDLKQQITRLAATPANPQPTSTAGNVELQKIMQRLGTLEQQIKASKANAMPLSPEIPAAIARKVTPKVHPRSVSTAPAKVPKPIKAPTPAIPSPAIPSATPDLPPPPPSSAPQPKQVADEKKQFASDDDGLLDALKKLDSI